MHIILGYLFTYIYIFSIIFLSNILKTKKVINEEAARKIVHIFVAFSWIIMYIYFKNTIHLIIPPLTFIILNYISYKKDLFSAMERKDKESLGTIYYAISLFIMSVLSLIFNNFIYCYGIGTFCMALGDGLAPIVAKSLKSPKILGNKTLLGSLTIFLSCIIIIYFINKIFFLNYDNYRIILLSFIATISELMSSKGTDNLTLPLITAVCSYIML